MVGTTLCVVDADTFMWKCNDCDAQHGHFSHPDGDVSCQHRCERRMVRALVHDTTHGAHVTVLHGKRDGHGLSNPRWMEYAQRVFFKDGRGRMSFITLVVIVSDGDGEFVEGWDRTGRYLRIDNVTQVRNFVV